MAAFVCAALHVPSASSASRSTLQHREHRQLVALYARAGTLNFFHHHPRLARTRAGRGALRVARIWVPILKRELAETRSALAPKPVSVPQVICTVFGSHCHEALRVSSCESGFSVNARNGQYLGLFQMGSHERATYGHGGDAWTQSRAAYRYFRAAGGWGPWECRP